MTAAPEPNEPPNISEAESAVMALLWRVHPLSAERVVAELGPERGWAEATVKTLLNRLLKKGAVTAAQDGRRYLYAPVLQREPWLAQQARGLLDGLFGGRVAPLVAHLGERGELSAKDLEDIKAVIAQMEATAQAAAQTTKKAGQA